ncbi:MAG: single-stranded-DNA-specific exonuclease RecJ [Chloroflexi bacterium]|nr:single-stranded-DNA-specific exonuclease RecJ [Chloroflexota bacterium]
MASSTTVTTTPAKRWRVCEEPENTPAGDWPPLIGRLLAYRGVTTAEAAQAFFQAAPATTPIPLPDLEIAAERLAQACRAGETVAVFGDFDVDGVTAAALLTESLTALGARPIPYIPHRDSEGYGLNNDAVESLHGLGATLLVTADCGTSSRDEIATARGHGMDVIVLDHHTVPETLPGANAIVNPKRDPAVIEEPAACGVAYYVLLALHEALDRPADTQAMLELVALATVCDLAPLTPGNRALLRDGLSAIARTKRPGLRALLAISGSDPAHVDTETIGFTIGPRLNAAGRMAHARLAFDLLVSRDEDEAQELASQLHSLNRERQQATEAAMALANELIADDADAPLLMLGHEELPAGIVGLVAARLADAYHRPAVIYQRSETESRASARSITGFDITAALRACPKNLFVRFGGHRMAAGFTAKNEHLPAIKQCLQSRAQEELAGRDLTPEIVIDAELPLSELRSEEIRWLAKLAPHGVGNPQPVFLSRGVLVTERREVGRGGAHLRLKLRDGPVIWQAIAFGQRGEGIEAGGRADLVYTLSADNRGGLELRVLDLRPGE